MVYNKAFKYPRYKKVFIDEITKTGFSDMRKKLQISTLQSQQAGCPVKSVWWLPFAVGLCSSLCAVPCTFLLFAGYPGVYIVPIQLECLNEVQCRGVFLAEVGAGVTTAMCSHYRIVQSSVVYTVWCDVMQSQQCCVVQ